MNEIMLDKVEKLKKEITNHPDFIRLNELEKELNENDEVMKLCYRKDVCVTNYEDSMRYFGENSDEALKAQKLLYDAKLELDLNPLVKKYNEQYKKVKELYDKINKEIFSKFN